MGTSSESMSWESSRVASENERTRRSYPDDQGTSSRSSTTSNRSWFGRMTTYFFPPEKTYASSLHGWYRTGASAKYLYDIGKVASPGAWVRQLGNVAIVPIARKVGGNLLGDAAFYLVEASSLYVDPTGYLLTRGIPCLFGQTVGMCTPTINGYLREYVESDIESVRLFSQSQRTAPTSVPQKTIVLQKVGQKVYAYWMENGEKLVKELSAETEPFASLKFPSGNAQHKEITREKKKQTIERIASACDYIHPELRDSLKAITQEFGYYIGGQANKTFSQSSLGQRVQVQQAKIKGKYTPEIMVKATTAWENGMKVFEAEVDKACRRVNFNPAVPIFMSSREFAEHQSSQAAIFAAEKEIEDNKQRVEEIHSSTVPGLNEAITQNQVNIEQNKALYNQLSQVNPAQLPNDAANYSVNTYGFKDNAVIATYIADQMIKKELNPGAWQAVYNTMLSAQNGRNDYKNLSHRIVEQQSGHMAITAQAVAQLQQNNLHMEQQIESVKQESEMLRAQIQVKEQQLEQSVKDYEAKLNEYQKKHFQQTREHWQKVHEQERRFLQLLQAAAGGDLTLSLEFSTLLKALEDDPQLSGTISKDGYSEVYRSEPIRIEQVDSNTINLVMPIAFRTALSNWGHGDVIISLNFTCVNGKLIYKIDSTFSLTDRQEYFLITIGELGNIVDKIAKEKIKSRVETDIIPILNSWLLEPNKRFVELVNGMDTGEDVSLQSTGCTIDFNGVSITPQGVSLSASLKPDFHAIISYSQFVELLNSGNGELIDYINSYGLELTQFQFNEAVLLEDGRLDVSCTLVGSAGTVNLSGEYHLICEPTFDLQTQSAVFSSVEVHSDLESQQLSTPVIEMVGEYFLNQLQGNLGGMISPQQLNSSSTSDHFDYQFGPETKVYYSKINLTEDGFSVDAALRNNFDDHSFFHPEVESAPRTSRASTSSTKRKRSRDEDSVSIETKKQKKEPNPNEASCSTTRSRKGKERVY